MKRGCSRNVLLKIQFKDYDIHHGYVDFSFEFIRKRSNYWITEFTECLVWSNIVII